MMKKNKLLPSLLIGLCLVSITYPMEDKSKEDITNLSEEELLNMAVQQSLIEACKKDENEKHIKLLHKTIFELQNKITEQQDKISTLQNLLKEHQNSGKEQHMILHDIILGQNQKLQEKEKQIRNLELTIKKLNKRAALCAAFLEEEDGNLT